MEKGRKGAQLLHDHTMPPSSSTRVTAPQKARGLLLRSLEGAPPGCEISKCKMVACALSCNRRTPHGKKKMQRRGGEGKQDDTQKGPQKRGSRYRKKRSTVKSTRGGSKKGAGSSWDMPRAWNHENDAAFSLNCGGSEMD